jgi:sensor histidine kinase YesM
MHERETYTANPLRIFEKILSFVVIPASGILIPLLFEVFHGFPLWKQLGFYITTVALSYVVWFGCRQMFIILRFSKKLKLSYPRYISFYSIFLMTYSFGIVFYTFKAINYYSGTQSKPVQIAGLTTLLTIFISAVYEIILLFEEKNTQQLNNIDLERAKTLTELNSLKSRIEPHFLFNSLNTLQNLISEDRELAHQFNRALTDIYHQILTVSDKNFVSVNDDLAMMYKYYELISIRFPEATKLSIDIEHFDLEAKLPPLSLQILLENALKHNRFSKKNPLRIEIEIDRNYISFTNNKTKSLPDVPKTKNGLKILADRYQLLQNKKIEIINDQSMFTVMLPL